MYVGDHTISEEVKKRKLALKQAINLDENLEEPYSKLGLNWV